MEIWYPINIIKLYSFDIDFQRDIKKDTIFEILYETLINVKRNTIEYGDIEYINLKIENKDLEYFIFFTEDGYTDYFDREGKNVKKSLLKTPIDGARLSSVMVGATGIEPVTPAVSRQCSTAELRTHYLKNHSLKIRLNFRIFT